MLQTDAKLPSAKTVSRNIKEFKDATDQSICKFLKVRAAAPIISWAIIMLLSIVIRVLKGRCTSVSTAGLRQTRFHSLGSSCISSMRAGCVGSY